MKKTSLWMICTGLCLMGFGCSLSSSYLKPSAPIPENWAGSSTGEQAVDDLAWDQFIMDAELKKLVAMALYNNRDLRQTLLNIQAVGTQYRIQDADKLPSFYLGTKGERRRTSGDFANDGRAKTTSSYQAGLGMSAFEVDLWGRVRDLSRAALEEYLASVEGGQRARMVLISQVAQAYILRVGAAEQYELTAKTLTAREASLALMVEKKNSGVGSDLDVEEAKSLAAQARADLESMDRQLRRADNDLMLLVGSSTPLHIEGKNTSSMVGDVAPGLSSRLILRRPDIREAEHRLMAAHARIGAARAAFFPSITLTGLGGSASTEFSGLFGEGTFAWQFLPRVSLPIFTHGKNQANLNVAEIRKDMAVATYESVIQSAFKDVADALAARDTLKREREYRKELVDASSRSLSLAKVRYEQGVDSHLRYLDAQRSNFANQIRLIQTRTQSRMARVQLFTALGGGWPSAS